MPNNHAFSNIHVGIYPYLFKLTRILLYFALTILCIHLNLLKDICHETQIPSLFTHPIYAS